MIPTGVLGVQVLVRAWVPVDDDHMMFWSFADPRTRAFGQGARPGSAAASGDPGATPTGRAGANGRMQFLPDTSDFMGKFHLTQNRGNDYGLDRELQMSGENYTGIPGIHQQDQAITESMGTIYERTAEHLGTSDAMVIRTRRRAINAAKALANQGVIPPGVDDATIYHQRSGGVILPRSIDWLEATVDLRKAFVTHAPEETFAPKATRKVTA
jgi:hypothetical protein